MCPMRIDIATYYPYVYLCICVLVLCKHLFLCICVQPHCSQCILSIIRDRKQTKYDTKVKFQINQHMYMCSSCSCCQNTLIHDPYTHIFIPYIYTYIICAYKRLQIFRLMPMSVMFSIFLLINEVFILQSLANVYYIYKHPCKRGCMSFIEGFFNCYYIVANAYNCQSLAICTNQQRTEREKERENSM